MDEHGCADNPWYVTVGEASDTATCGRDDEIIQPPWNETVWNGCAGNHPRPSDNPNGLVGVWRSDVNEHEISCSESIWCGRLWKRECWSGSDAVECRWSKGGSWGHYGVPKRSKCNLCVINIGI